MPPSYRTRKAPVDTNPIASNPPRLHHFNPLPILPRQINWCQYPPSGTIAETGTCTQEHQIVINQRFVYAAALVALAGSAATAQTLQWDGEAGDGQWTSNSNWDPDGAPGSSSDVIIPSAAGQVTITLADANCGTLTCSSSLRLASSSITVNGDASVTNMIFDPPGFVPTVHANGNFVISGNSQSTGGFVDGIGLFQNAGTFDQFAGFTLDTIPASNTGTWALASGASLHIRNAASFDNNGTLTLADAAEITELDSLGFTNNGTIRHEGPGLSYINAELDSLSGSLQADTGSLAVISDSWEVGGTISVTNSGLVLLSGENNPATRDFYPTSLSGNGTVALYPNNDVVLWSAPTSANVSGGGLNIFPGLVNLSSTVNNSGTINLFGPELYGPGSINNTGTINIPAGSAAKLELPLSNSGTVNVASTLLINEANILTNELGGTINLSTGFIGSQTLGNPGRILNNGVVQYGGQNAPFPFEIRIPYDSSSTGSIGTTGSIILSGGGNLDGGYATVSQDFTPLGFHGSTDTTYNITQNFFIQGIGTADFGDFPNIRPIINVDAALVLAVSDLGTPHPSFGGAQFRGATFQGSGLVRNFELLRWQAGTIAVNLENHKTMQIDEFSDQILKSTLTNLDTVYQISYLTIDGGTIDNQGTWNVDNGAFINIGPNGGTFNNTGTIKVGFDSNEYYAFYNIFNNTGSFFIFQGAVFFESTIAQLNAGLLNGGFWNITPGATVQFPEPVTTIEGPAQITAGTNEMPQLASLANIINAAEVTLLDTELNGDLDLTNNALLTARGLVHLPGTLTATGTSTVTIEPNATINADTGTQIGSPASSTDTLIMHTDPDMPGATPPNITTPILDLYATLSLGPDGTGLATVTGDLLMRDSATLTLNLAPATAGGHTADQLQIIGNATLAGTANITVKAPGLTAGETFTILQTTGTITGTIDAVQTPGLASNLTITLSQTANTLTATVAASCTADLNSDGILDFFDVQSFLGLFAAQDPAADFNNDNNFDFFDVQAFLNAYSAGCP